jgi:hypothetical protein
MGQAYRNAIRSYYDNAPGSAHSYPRDFDALLLDGRSTRRLRPLRKLYRDPVSGSADWGIVRTPDGAIKGVYSLSNLKPLKTGGFPPELESFNKARRYSQWLFVYEPAATTKVVIEDPEK